MRRDQLADGTAVLRGHSGTACRAPTEATAKAKERNPELAKNRRLRRVLTLAQAEAYATEWLLLFWLRWRDYRGFFLFEDCGGGGDAVAFFEAQQSHALR